MKGVEKCISPIEWDRNSEDNIMEEHDQGLNNQVNEIQRICSQSLSQIDNTYRLPNKIKYLFQETRYFMIKSNNFENVSLAKVRNVWATTRANEIRLNKAFYETKNVLLIFSVKESGKFQGYARLATPSNPKKYINWVLPSHMSQRQLSGIFEIDWLSREDQPFSKTNHLVNAWNEHKPVKIGRDGQEIEPSCGEFLCRLFPIDEDCPFNEIIEKAKCGSREFRSSNQCGSNNDTNLPIEGRPQDYYSSNVISSHDNYGCDNYRTSEYRRCHSRSKGRTSDAYVRPSRSRDRQRRENSDVFLNGNYEDYLREQTSFSRTCNPYSSDKYNNNIDCDRYEQRVDDFLRNIVNRDPVVQHREKSSEGSMTSSSSSCKRKDRRSRSFDRRSRRSRSYDRRSRSYNRRSHRSRSYDRRTHRSRSYDRRSHRSDKGHSRRYRSRSRHRR